MSDGDWIEPAVRLNATDQIRAALIRAIREGQLPVGSKLPSESDLAQRFGVERPVIREALGSLRVLGLTASQTGRGTFVISPDVKLPLALGAVSSEDLYEARLFLEVPAARLAALRRTSADVDELQASVARYTEAIEPEARVKDDVHFHPDCRTGQQERACASARRRAAVLPPRAVAGAGCSHRSPVGRRCRAPEHRGGGGRRSGRRRSPSDARPPARDARRDRRVAVTRPGPVGPGDRHVFGSRVVVGTGGRVLTDAVVTVRGDTIVRVGPPLPGMTPFGGQAYETVLPGLIDSHVHVAFRTVSGFTFPADRGALGHAVHQARTTLGNICSGTASRRCATWAALARCLCGYAMRSPGRRWPRRG